MIYAEIIDFLLYLVVAIVTVIIGFAVAGICISDIADFDIGLIVGGLVLALAFPFLALLVLFIIQLVLLATRGQTIGKIIMKIRIVDAVTGQHPGWARLILLRTIVNSVIISFLNILPGAGRRILSR